MKKLLIILAVAMTLSSCTDNTRARNFGGIENVSLMPGEKFINMTWKDTNLWILTQDQNGTYHFREKSSMGWFEGEIIVNEVQVQKEPAYGINPNQ